MGSFLEKKEVHPSFFGFTLPLPTLRKQGIENNKEGVGQMTDPSAIMTVLAKH